MPVTPSPHQRKIALATLRMPDAMIGVMGGPTKQEAIDILLEKFGYTEDQIRKLLEQDHSSEETDSLLKPNIGLDGEADALIQNVIGDRPSDQ